LLSLCKDKYITSIIQIIIISTIFDSCLALKEIEKLGLSDANCRSIAKANTVLRDHFMILRL